MEFKFRDVLKPCPWCKGHVNLDLFKSLVDQDTMFSICCIECNMEFSERKLDKHGTQTERVEKLINRWNGTEDKDA